MAQDAPAPIRVWPEAERAAHLIFWILVYVSLFRLFLKAGTLATADGGVTVPRTDFAAYWAAARLAFAGEPLAAFDPAVLLAASELSGETPKNLLWLYPPHFLALITPLGALPYWAAWSIFVLVSAVTLGVLSRAPAEPLPGGWRLIVVSPLLLFAVFNLGQISALWTAALIAALWSLRQRRHTAAGFWIALLTLKPQLGLLIPLALAADRQWRTIGWATGFSLLMMLGATLMFGWAYWPHFFAALMDVTARLEDGVMTVARQISFYGLGRNLGLGHDAALWIHWPCALALAAAVAWTWSRREVPCDLKAALLCAAIPLVTVYAFYYEMTVMLAAGLFLYRDGFGQGLAARLWLVVIWFGPIPALYTPAFTDEVTFLAVPIILVTVVICLVRSWRCTRSAAP